MHPDPLYPDPDLLLPAHDHWKEQVLLLQRLRQLVATL